MTTISTRPSSNRSVFSVLLLFTLSVLAACDGSSSVSDIQKQGQRPPPTCTDNFQQVECPDQPVRAQNIFVSVVDGAGDLLQADIVVRQFMADGSSFSGFAVRDSDYTVALAEDGRYTLAFDSAIPTRLDTWIEARLNDGTVLRRALPSGDRNVVISVNTEYAIRTFLATLGGNSALLNAIIPCVRNSENCQTQDDTRLRYWRALSDTAAAFPVPAGSSSEQALGALANQIPFNNTISQLAATIVADLVPNPVSAEDTSQLLLDRAGTYHSAAFALSLGQGQPDSAAPQAVFSNSLDTIVAVGGASGSTQFAYPQLTYTPAIISRVTETIPFNRLAVARSADGSFTAPQTVSPEDAVSFLARGIPTVLRRDALFEVTQLEVQDVVQDKSATPTGYVSEPYSALLYSLRTAASGGTEQTDGFSDSLVAGFFQTARYVELVNQSGSGLLPQSTLEDVRSVVWNFHSKRTPFSTDSTLRRDFSLDRIADQRYGFVSISQLFGTDPAVSLFSSIELWNVSPAGDFVSVSRPDANAEGNQGGKAIFSTVRSAIAANDSRIQPNTIGEESPSLTVSLLANQRQITGADNRQQLVDSQRGRLQVGSLRGFSDAAGNILSFSIDDQETSITEGAVGTGDFPLRGRGIGHAVRLTSELPNLAGLSYRLSGHSLGFLTDGDRLSTFTDSELTFGNDLLPSLSLSERFVERPKGTAQVTEFQSVPQTQLPTVTASEPVSSLGPIGNALQMSFADPAGGSSEVLMEGFVTADATLLVLRLRYGDRIGLVYGTLDRRLAVSSSAAASAN